MNLAEKISEYVIWAQNEKKKIEDIIELFEGHPHPHHFQTNGLPLIVVNIYLKGTPHCKQVCTQ
jgi:hypothetical protein